MPIEKIECYSCIYFKSNFFLKDNKVSKIINTCKKHDYIIEDEDSGCIEYKKIKLKGVSE